MLTRLTTRVLVLAIVLLSVTVQFTYAQEFSFKQVRSYPFPTELTAAATGARIAWAFDEQGARNIYVAEGPNFTPRRLTNYMIDAGIPEKLFEFTESHVAGRISFLLYLLVFLLILGAILDIFSAIVLVVPLVLPIAAQYGVDPLHLGIMFLATMQLGYLTPPVGLNLFIASYRFNTPIMQVYSATFPFLLILLVAVLIITFVPALSVWFK